MYTFFKLFTYLELLYHESLNIKIMEIQVFIFRFQASDLYMIY